MPIVMGIDGGGSTIRVAVTDHDLTVLGESRGETVNPSIIGHDSAAQRIREAMQAALYNAGVTADQIDGVGIGVAGAAAQHSATWLCEVVSSVLPSAFVVPSSDLEIALVGARGERRGILILAGTGSAAYGVNDSGESALVGGWGYLLGDEGSGYWIGKEALRLIASADDGIAEKTALSTVVLSALGLQRPRDLTGWLYQKPRNQEIAALAPTILKIAGEGDPVANKLITKAADALAALSRAAAKKLQIENPDYALAGGLLETPNLLTKLLCENLSIPEIPPRLHPPVIGAALLALLHLK